MSSVRTSFDLGRRLARAGVFAIAFAFSSALAVAQAAVPAPQVATPPAVSQMAQGTPATLEELAEYAERELAAPELTQFEGGGVIVITTTVVLIVVVVILLIVLL